MTNQDNESVLGTTTQTESCVVLTPVLVPYVQAPVHYVKSNLKEDCESQPLSQSKIKYIPAYTCPTIRPRCLYYSRNSTVPIPVANARATYAMPINHEASSISRGYVSALSPPSSYFEAAYNWVSNSELNLLSRPYTPPSRRINCDEKNIEEGIKSYEKYVDMTSPTPTVDEEESEMDEVSREKTPEGDVCPSCRKQTEVHMSDTDSGVEGESDEETCCSCIEDSPYFSYFCKNLHENDEEYPNLLSNVCKNNKEKLPDSFSDLLNFTCEHLASHEWRTVARELGVSDVIIQSVEYDVYDNFREEMKFVFTFWARSLEEPSVDEAYRQMRQALLEIGRNDLVGELQAREIEISCRDNDNLL